MCGETHWADDLFSTKEGDGTADHSVSRTESLEIVVTENVSVLLPRSRPALTPVTCYPFYFIGSAPKRFILHASIAESDLRLGRNTPNSEVRTTNKQEVPK